MKGREVKHRLMVVMPSRLTPAIYESRYRFHEWTIISPEELPSRLKSMATYLRRIRRTLIEQGQSSTWFRSGAWLEQFHSQLYPAYASLLPHEALQGLVSGHEHCLDSVVSLSDAARTLLCRCARHRTRLVECRTRLLHLKLKILDRLSNLRQGAAPAGRVWEAGISVMTEELSQEQVITLLHLDAEYLRLDPATTAPSGDHAQPMLRLTPKPTKYDLYHEPERRLLLPGGLTSVVALLAECEMSMERKAWWGRPYMSCLYPSNKWRGALTAMISQLEVVGERLQHVIVQMLPGSETLTIDRAQLRQWIDSLKGLTGLLERALEGGPLAYKEQPDPIPVAWQVSERREGLTEGPSDAWAPPDSPPKAASKAAALSTKGSRQERYRFKHLGKGWLLAFNTADLPFPDNKGLHYLRILLAEPERLFDVATLWPAVNRSKAARRRRLQPGPPKVTRRELIEKQELLNLIDEKLLQERETLDDVEGAVARIAQLEKTRADLVRDAQAVARFGNTLISKHKNLKKARIRRDDERGITSEAINVAITRAIEAVGEEPLLTPLAEHLREHINYARNKFSYHGIIRWDT